MENIIASESMQTFQHINWVIGALLAVFLILLFLTLFVRSFLKKINLLKKDLQEFEGVLKQVSQKLENNEAQNRTMLKDIGVLKNQMREEFNLTKLSLSNQIDSLLLNLKNSKPDSPEVLIPRLEAYKRLWEITEIANPNRLEPLNDNEKQNLRSELSSWYFEDGNGIFLSSDSTDMLRTCIQEISEATFETVKYNLSQLRAQLKNDLELYDLIDGDEEISVISG